MIRIVANINIQVIQRKKSVPLVVPLPTPTPTPSSHPTTGELNSISETDELTSPSQMESPDRNKENGLGERGHPLDFTELAKRLRDAYRTPDHPSLTISVSACNVPNTYTIEVCIMLYCCTVVLTDR